ncbi:unnamed protein product [Rotaria socialis]|uniref:Uncharacterized protein n=2 Tax=Rotaria socialis TaxID=392032 RepID=A0A821EP98_9BILA|nr:unnamed protein product [Rotaria socialis]
MSLLLRPLIDELLNLERGEHFDFHDQDNNGITARAFLIGACYDKPAQALLQFLPEPTAAFGCGRCEAKGFMDELIQVEGITIYGCAWQFNGDYETKWSLIPSDIDILMTHIPPQLRVNLALPLKRHLQQNFVQCVIIQFTVAQGIWVQKV